MRSLFVVVIAALFLASFVDAEIVRLSQSVVSDTTTQVNGPNRVGSAAPAFALSSSWTAIIPGATWIWDIPFASTPSTGSNVSFKKSFFIGGTPVSGFLQIAADNVFTATVNNQLVACAGGSDNFNAVLASQQICEVSAFLEPGLNYLKVDVSNLPGTDSSSVNTAGLIFKLTFNSHLVV